MEVLDGVPAERGDSHEHGEPWAALQTELDARRQTLAEERDAARQPAAGAATAVQPVGSPAAGLEKDRRRWRARQKKAESQAAADALRDAARQAELDVREHVLTDRQQQWQADREESQRQFGRQGQQSAALQAELEARQGRG